MLVARNLASRSIKWRAQSSSLWSSLYPRIGSAAVKPLNQHLRAFFFTSRVTMSQEQGSGSGAAAAAPPAAGEQQHVPRPVHSSQHAPTQHAPTPSEGVSANGAAAPAANSAKKQAKADKKSSKKGDDIATNMAALEVSERTQRVKCSSLLMRNVMQYYCLYRSIPSQISSITDSKCSMLSKPGKTQNTLVRITLLAYSSPCG